MSSDQTSSRSTSSPFYRFRRANERGFSDFGWADNWLTFSFGDYLDAEWTGFGPLRVIVENHIQPRSGFPPHPHREVEIITYVAAGTLSHRDSFGHVASITAGEMQLISAGSRGMVHSEENRHDEVEHNLQVWLVPKRTETEFAYHQLMFSPAERQGHFRLYVSPDGRDGSMPVNTDALVYAGLFSAGDRVEYLPAPGHGVWIQVVVGAVTVASRSLGAGDGLGVTDAERVHLEFEAASEVVLFDVRMDVPLIWR